nr:glycosyltransferase family 4 protein [Lachnospiraceae bacterium]
PRVLMAGPARDVRGGVSALVNVWYSLGIDRMVQLTYLPTMRDGSALTKLLVFAGAWLRFGPLMRRHDILHVHLSPRASFARKAMLVKRAHRMGKRIIIHQHGGSFGDFYYKEAGDRKRRYIRKIFAMADRVIVLSGEWRDFFADGICDPAKITVLYNGVPIPESIPTERHDHNILYLGQLTKMKGIYDLLDAISEVLASVPDAQFFLCGDNGVEQCLQRVREAGIEEHVHLPGWIDEKKREELFSSCSVFVLPSYIEGMPMSLLEAMSRGLACVATSVGGIPEIIESGTNGILIEPGNAGVLAQALIRLLTDEEERGRIGAEGADTIRKRFDARDSLKKILELYAACTSKISIHLSRQI